MNSKIKWAVIAVGIILIVASVAAIVHIRNENLRNSQLPVIELNEYLVDSVDFSISDNDLGSEMAGTVFVYDINGTIETVLMADFHISAEDRNGIMITTSPEFYVTSVDTNYHEEYPDNQVSSKVIMNEEDGVEIRVGHIPADDTDSAIGGDGTVVIKMDPSKNLNGKAQVTLKIGIGNQHDMVLIDLPQL